MTLYAFVLTVKYTKEYCMSETSAYKITSKFNDNTSHCMRSISSHSH